MYCRHGGVAQLGERDTGSVEVMGSSPTVSTIAENVEFITFSAIFLHFSELKYRAENVLKANAELTRRRKQMLYFSNVI